MEPIAKTEISRFESLNLGARDASARLMSPRVRGNETLANPVRQMRPASPRVQSAEFPFREILPPPLSLICAAVLRLLIFGGYVLWCCALAAANRVVIITPHVDAIRSEFARGFAQWHARTYGETAEAEFRQVGGTSDALRFVLSEFAQKPGGIGLDCFWGGGEEPFLVLGDKRVLMRYDHPAEILSGIPESINGVEVYDPNHTWYGAALSSFGILENLRVQRLAGLPFVRQWEELARPELFGWVGVGDPRNSGTMN